MAEMASSGAHFLAVSDSRVRRLNVPNVSLEKQSSYIADHALVSNSNPETVNPRLCLRVLVAQTPQHLLKSLRPRLPCSKWKSQNKQESWCTLQSRFTLSFIPKAWDSRAISFTSTNRRSSRFSRVSVAFEPERIFLYSYTCLGLLNP